MNWKFWTWKPVVFSKAKVFEKGEVEIKEKEHYCSCCGDPVGKTTTYKIPTSNISVEEAREYAKKLKYKPTSMSRTQGESLGTIDSEEAQIREDNYRRRRTAALERHEQSNNEDFLTSMIVAEATDSVALGAMVGGSITGAIVGDMMNDRDNESSVTEIEQTQEVDTPSHEEVEVQEDRFHEVEIEDNRIEDTSFDTTDSFNYDSNDSSNDFDSSSSSDSND